MPLIMPLRKADKKSFNTNEKSILNREENKYTLVQIKIFFFHSGEKVTATVCYLDFCLSELHRDFKFCVRVEKELDTVKLRFQISIEDQNVSKCLV